MFRLRVIAKNPGSAERFSVAVVNIQVINVNDQAPVITVNNLFGGEIGEDTTPVSQSQFPIEMGTVHMTLTN